MYVYMNSSGVGNVTKVEWKIKSSNTKWESMYLNSREKSEYFSFFYQRDLNYYYQDIKDFRKLLAFLTHVHIHKYTHRHLS